MKHSIVVVGLLISSSVAVADTPAFEYGHCITDDDRQAAADGAGDQAFRASSVPLGPFFWASADRTFVQAMLVYWRFLDIDDETRLTLTAPLAFDLCTNEQRTVTGPFAVYGVKRDQDGIAGFVGPYFFRRDQAATSDVLFPVWFRFSDSKGDKTEVLGPTFALERSWGRASGALPLYAHADIPSGSFTLAPGTLWVDSPSGEAHIVGPYAHVGSSRGAVSGLFPLWFSAASGDESRRLTLAPALGWLSFEADDRSATVLGPYFSFQGPARTVHGVAGLYAASREGDRAALVVPPLLYAQFDEGERTDRVMGPVALTTDERGYALYAPGALLGRDRDGWDYELVPFWARLAKADGELLLAGPYLGYADDGGHESHVFGVYAEGDIKDPAHYRGPLGLTSWLDVKHVRYRALTGVWFDFAADDDVTVQARGPWTTARLGDYTAQGFAPFSVSGQSPDGAGFDLIPPLLTAHLYDGDDHTLYAAGTKWTSSPGHFGVHAPGALWANFDDEQSFVLAPPALLGVYLGDDVRTAMWGPLGAAQVWDDQAVWAFPAFLHRRNRRDGTYTTVALPFGGGWGDAAHDNFVIGLAGHFEEGDVTTEVFAPLMARRFGPDGHWLAAPGLAAWGDGPSREASTEATVALGPLYAHKHAHGGRALVPPLYAGAWHDEEGYIHAVPPLLFAAFGDARGQGRILAGHYRVEGPAGHDEGVFPFFATGRATGPGPSPLVAQVADITGTHIAPRTAQDFHYTVAPFFVQSGHDGVEDTLAFQTFAQTRPDGRTLLSVPFLYHDKSGDETTWIVPPALFGYGLGPDAQTLWMGNLLASVGPDAKRLMLAPVLFAGEDESGGYAFGPGYYFGRNDFVRTLAVGQTLMVQSPDGKLSFLASAPFFVGGEWDDVNFAFSPVAHYAHARWGDKFDLRLWGGAYHARYERSQWAGVFPVLFTHQDEDSMSLRAPLLYAARDPDRRSLHIAQTFVEDGPDGLAVQSHPFYYGHRAPNGSSQDVMPLLLSAFFRDVDPQGGITDAAYVGPLFRRVSPASHEAGVYGLWADGQGTDLPVGEAMLFPAEVLWPRSVYAGDGQAWRYTVRPGIVSARSEDGTRQTVIAGQTVFSRGPDAQTLVSLPLAYHHAYGGASTTVIPPLLFWQEHDPVRAVKTTAAPGLLLYDRREPGRHAQVFGPSFVLEEQGETTRGVLPLFVQSQGPHHNNVIVPGGLRIREPGLSVDAAGPLFVARQDGDLTEGALPFYLGHRAAAGPFVEGMAPLYVRWGDRAAAEDRTVVPLLLAFVGRSDETTSLVAPGIWSRRTDTTGETFVFPLFADVQRERFAIRTVAGAYNEVRVGDVDVTVAPLYAEVNNPETKTVLVGPLAWERPTEGDGYSFYLGPVFSYATLHQDHQRWRVLFGAFGYEREGSTEEFTLFWQKNRRAL